MTVSPFDFVGKCLQLVPTHSCVLIQYLKLQDVGSYHTIEWLNNKGDTAVIPVLV